MESFPTLYCLRVARRLPARRRPSSLRRAALSSALLALGRTSRLEKRIACARVWESQSECAYKATHGGTTSGERCDDSGEGVTFAM